MNIIFIGKNKKPHKIKTFLFLPAPKSFSFGDDPAFYTVILYASAILILDKKLSTKILGLKISTELQMKKKSTASLKG